MKIATWNLDRPKAKSAKNMEILSKLRDIDADILILTETNFAIDPGMEYTPLSSELLPVPGHYRYTHGENVTTIWSKYPLSRIQTRHPSITACAKVQTPHGQLTVYGTVIGTLGIVGSARNVFELQLKEQVEDWKRISAEEDCICVVGDFNVCWKGKDFPQLGRDEITKCFDKLGLLNLTHDIEGNLDHIAISRSFLKNAKCETKPKIWNAKRKLRSPYISDHIGVCVTLGFPK